MRSGSRLAAGVLSVAAITLTAAPAASASPTPLTGGGTLQLGPPTLIWQTTVGSNLITDEDGSLAFAGTIAGTGTIDVLADVSPGGSETFVARWSAPATVDGRSGVLDISFEGTDNGTFSGRLFATGVGGLAGVLAEGSFTGQDATGAGTYTLTYLNT